VVDAVLATAGGAPLQAAALSDQALVIEQVAVAEFGRIPMDDVNELQYITNAQMGRLILFLAARNDPQPF
jgi:hypothetical protein